MGKANSITNWKYRTQHVQNDLKPGEFVNSATTLLAFGPPDLDFNNISPNDESAQDVNGSITRRFNLDANTTAKYYPVGVSDTINMSQNKSIQRLYEIGSYINYIIPGYTICDANVSRVFYNGPSLLRCMMAYYKDISVGSTEMGPAGTGEAINPGYSDLEHFYDFSTNNMDLQDPAGYNGLWLNLASDLFDFPLGILMTFMDTRKRLVGSVFLKNCYISVHNMSIAAQTFIIGENVTLAFEKVVPVRITVSSIIPNAATV